IYKLSSKKQITEANDSYSKESVKLPLKCNISIKKDEPVTIEVKIDKSDNYLYNNISTKIQSTIIPELALNSPITQDRIMSQLKKINDTPCEFTKIDVDLDDGLLIPSIKGLNELRRMELTKIEKMIIQKHKRSAELEEKS